MKGEKSRFSLLCLSHWLPSNSAKSLRDLRLKCAKTTAAAVAAAAGSLPTVEDDDSALEKERMGMERRMRPNQRRF